MNFVLHISHHSLLLIFIPSGFFRSFERQIQTEAEEKKNYTYIFNLKKDSCYHLFLTFTEKKNDEINERERKAMWLMHQYTTPYFYKENVKFLLKRNVISILITHVETYACREYLSSQD